MRLNRFRHHAIFLGLVGLSALLVAGACRGRSRASADTAAPPEIAKVETRDLDVRAEAAGTIQPLKIVEVKSRVAGELQRLAADTNQMVAQGALLAEIDPRDVNNAFEQATADLEVAKARVQTTAAQARRADQLFAQGVVAAQDRETADLTATNAKADLLKAQTNLDLARQRLGDVKIRAPISGTIIERTVEQGQIVTSASGNVSGGTTLVKMADLSIMQARALVDEVDIGRMSPGQPVEVTVEAYPGRTFRGTVEKIEPLAVVDQNITMFPVLVNLTNPEGLLKPGMNAEVSVAIAQRRGVTAVPNSAVVAIKDLVSVGTMLGLDATAMRGKLGAMHGGPGGREGGDHRSGRRPTTPTSDREEAGHPGFVFVQGMAGPEARAVRLGVSDWDFTEVISGVAAGDPVYLISVARMQQQQQRMSDRMRQSTGFGGGAPSGGGRPPG
ncbi:MAG TPA: efflux RND transporter periplasmic adaptor subunit [Thermoanaerobaculia bacterium]|jgi:HlyD family secretion protein|nr:efflux RND transporter periplasmic adaptor subunit [Thermoanaerobaculia bacterium]